MRLFRWCCLVALVYVLGSLSAQARRSSYGGGSYSYGVKKEDETSEITSKGKEYGGISGGVVLLFILCGIVILCFWVAWRCACGNLDRFRVDLRVKEKELNMLEQSSKNEIATLQQQLVTVSRAFKEYKNAVDKEYMGFISGVGFLPKLGEIVERVWLVLGGRVSLWSRTISDYDLAHNSCADLRIRARGLTVGYKQLQRECDVLKARVEIYEGLAPYLVDVDGWCLGDVLAAMKGDKLVDIEGFDYVSTFLSEGEWRALSDVERGELALERYFEGRARSPEMAKLAHEQGISQEIFGKLVEAKFAADAAVAEREQAEHEEAVAAGVATLRDEWGDEFGLKLTAANDGLRKVAAAAGLNAEDVLKNPLVRSNLDLVRMFAVIGTQFGGGSGVPASGASVPVGAGGAAEAERIIHDASHPLHEAFMSSSHPNHKYANERVNASLGIA